MLKKKPLFIINYQCYSCNQQCSYTDTQKATCRYCEEWVNMVETGRQPIAVPVPESPIKNNVSGMLSRFDTEKEVAYTFN